MRHGLAEGDLEKAEYETDPVFHLDYPKSCPNVPSELLDPSTSWADQAEYKQTQMDLAKLFNTNFAKYADQATPEVRAQGPDA